MMQTLYRIGTGAYHLGVGLAASLGNERAREWKRGRREDALPPPKTERRRLWVHCASLGEWEQGRPVVEAWRELHPDWEVVLSFFSPSGYLRRKDDPAVDHVRYLPEDTPRNATEWVEQLRPDLAVFVKYEFWFYYLRALRRTKVPTYLVAASFRPGQVFFKPWAGWWRRMLDLFSGIICQTVQDKKLLAENGGYPAERIWVLGDPRVDRVLELANTPFTDKKLAAFTAGSEITLLAGSTWPRDLRVLRAAWPAVAERCKLIIAPHELQEAELARTQVQWGALRHGATVDEAALSAARVLIIDSIGILSRAYRYADLAYVGGAFKTGLHNTLEPMAYGLPTLFGPEHQKFPEAGRAVAAGGAISVADADELKVALCHLLDPTRRDAAATAQRSLTATSAGAARATAELLSRQLNSARI